MPEFKVRIIESWTRRRAIIVTAMNSLDAEYGALTAYTRSFPDRDTEEGAREYELERAATECGFVIDLEVEDVTEQ